MLTPITAPSPFTRGPPELPPLKATSVWISLRPVPLSVKKRLMLPVVTVASFFPGGGYCLDRHIGGQGISHRVNLAS